MGDFFQAGGIAEYIYRWGHFLFGITWIGILYYFNFIQGEYFKEAEPDAKSDAVKKLAPRALWWFRWGAMGTFITGLLLLTSMHARINPYIIVGATMGTLMFLNVWLIIWPAQKIVCGLVEGDAAVAGPKALLASRTNTLFSAPMLFFMGSSFHLSGYMAEAEGMQPTFIGQPLSLWVTLALVAALEINAIFGKLGPIETVKGVIHSSLALTLVMFLTFMLI